MSLEVFAVGPMATVQDQGRFGLRRYGVSNSGPMDIPAMTLANALCGNKGDAAAIEFAAFGGRFRVSRPVRFAVTGARCDIRIGTRNVSLNEAYRLQPDDELTIGTLECGFWGYLAVSGGISTPLVLGSRSTHLRSGLGGVEGRRLRVGDRLPLGADIGSDVCRRAKDPPARPLPQGPLVVRVVLGPQDSAFTSETLSKLTESEFEVSAQRDRMGMVLEGPTLPARDSHDIISDAVVPGVIQVPGSGKPTILMAESQTTGGYPKIATVIGPDLPRLAQAQTGQRIRIAAIDRDEAELAAIRSARVIGDMLSSIVAKSENDLTSEYLLGCDLVGGIYTSEDIVPDAKTTE